LLDELSTLADGDLTVKASVTEEITGAIADSINYAVEAPAQLGRDHSCIGNLSRCCREVYPSSGRAHLAKASAGQSKQVASATESIAEMASSIEGVSGNARDAQTSHGTR
jgi:twitching motility protein PilJ